MGRWLGYGMIALLASCGGVRRGLVKEPGAGSRPAAVARVQDLPSTTPPLAEQDLAPGPGAQAPGPEALRAAGEDMAADAFLGAVPGHRDDDACLGQALSRLTVHAKGDTAVVSGQLDLGPCLVSSLSGGPSTEVLGASETLRFYVRISCDGVDLGRFDGVAYGALVDADAHPCADARGAGVVVQTDDVQQARVRRLTPDGLVTAEEGRRHVQAQGGRGGGACRYELKDGRLVRGACEVVARDVVTRARSERDGVVDVRPEEGRETYVRQDVGAVE